MGDTSGASLLVTVTPSQSAFFAGEVFAATITFANPAAAVPLPLPPATRGPPTRRVTPHEHQHQHQHQRDHPAGAAHLALAEYATSHLDTDEVPPSPFIGNRNRSRNPNRNRAFRPAQPALAASTADLRSSSVSTTSGGALPTPVSAAFAQRSASTNASPVASTSRTALPSRKGLIGKPLLPHPIVERRVAGGGLYNGGPRRPDGSRGHSRAQSMAVSSPDLLESTPSPAKGHGRSRLGGSMAIGNSSVEGLGINGRRSGHVPPAIMEESASPVPTSGFTSTTSPPPSGATTPSTSTPSLNLGSPFPDDSPHSPYSQNQLQSNPNSSAVSISDDDYNSNDGSDYDPTDSTSVLPGAGFYGVGQNDTMESVAREGLEDWTRRATRPGASSLQASYSTGPTMSSFEDEKQRAFADRRRHPTSTLNAPRNGFLHPPNTISILWSFAHLEGTFEVEDALIKPAEFVEVKKTLLGGKGTGVGMGGGTLEDAVARGGWKNWLFGADQAQGTGATLEDRKNYTMKEKTIPTFSSPPSILGIDLVLEPGQSKSYSFSIRIPADLPPSFRGKAIKFSYHLVVGTNRVILGSAASTPARSRVMRVPVRVYNHVGITGARPFYDLTNPIVNHRDEATTSGVDDPQVAKLRRRPSAGREDFEAYAAALLDSVISNASPDMRTEVALSPTISQKRTPALVSPTMESPPSMRPEMRPQMQSLQSALAIEDDEGVGCKAAVEIVSRNSQKVSYDINKDGYMVASLTLVKSAYRLGETVNGSVVINSGEGRVLRVSARLETHELIETTIATKPAPQVRQITRRLHAEHHEMTLDSARVGFALAIPSGATPDFATSGVKLQWSVRLSFLVIPPSPDMPILKPGERPRPGVRVPPPPLPSSASRHGRSKSFAYGFEPAVPLTLPAAPLIQPTGATHLMPVSGPLDASSAHTSYRAVPDLGYVPVLYSSAAPELPPSPGPLQRTASGNGGHRSTGSMAGTPPRPNATPQTNVVLVPAKVETVECSIPIKVYPGNTPFRPTISCFDDTR